MIKDHQQNFFFQAEWAKWQIDILNEDYSTIDNILSSSLLLGMCLISLFTFF